DFKFSSHRVICTSGTGGTAAAEKAIRKRNVDRTLVWLQSGGVHHHSGGIHNAPSYRSELLPNRLHIRIGFASGFDVNQTGLADIRDSRIVVERIAYVRWLAPAS